MITKADALQDLLHRRPAWASNIILAGLRGSDAHGTKLPDDHPKHTDDMDTFGISVYPPEWYLGLGGFDRNHRKLSWDSAGDFYDHLVHDVRKFLALAAKGNPNVHCWLWADPEDVTLTTYAGKLIRRNRRLFLSRRCFTALAGYARAQMAKMEKAPTSQAYMGEKRKALAAEHGYDVKHAAHCVRLLQMGLELALEGRMSTRRPHDEAQELMAIKAGERSFDHVKGIIGELWGEFREAEDSVEMPHEVDRVTLDRLCVTVIYTADAMAWTCDACGSRVPERATGWCPTCEVDIGSFTGPGALDSYLARRPAWVRQFVMTDDPSVL